MIYVTDGSFEGILTAVFEAYRLKEIPENIVSGESYQIILGSETREIQTDNEKSDRVYKSVSDKMSHEALEILYRAWLAGSIDVGIRVYRYIRIGLKLGKKIIYYLQDSDVLWINDMSQKVLTEVHLFLGILRFKKIGSVYYAKYEPDNNITMLLSDHFADRLSDQPWIIHDARRDICALYNTRELVFTNEHLSIPENESDEEFESLWSRYFKSIAIESRYNPKLQRQFLPQRYWKNLVEKNNLIQ